MVVMPFVIIIYLDFGSYTDGIQILSKAEDDYDQILNDFNYTWLLKNQHNFIGD